VQTGITLGEVQPSISYYASSIQDTVTVLKEIPGMASTLGEDSDNTLHSKSLRCMLPFGSESDTEFLR